jgi:16S rRNA (guanine966-N2)-methyltransferase
VRITGGTVKGHTLLGPKSGSKGIRPTSDRVREALFTILAADLQDSTVLDLYAGTGSLGIEALSRGAEAAVFVDQSRQALTLIHSNLSSCFADPRALLIQLNLSRADSGRRLQSKLPADLLFDLVFLDPPYEKKLAEKSLLMVESRIAVRQGGLVIVEERKGVQFPEQWAGLKLIDQRNYGETGLWIYQQQKEQQRLPE